MGGLHFEKVQPDLRDGEVSFSIVGAEVVTDQCGDDEELAFGIPGLDVASMSDHSFTSIRAEDNILLQSTMVEPYECSYGGTNPGTTAVRIIEDFSHAASSINVDQRDKFYSHAVFL